MQHRYSTGVLTAPSCVELASHPSWSLVQAQMAGLHLVVFTVTLELRGDETEMNQLQHNIGQRAADVKGQLT